MKMKGDMSMAEHLHLVGSAAGESGEPAVKDAGDPFAIRRMPLAPDVVATFRVLHALPARNWLTARDSVTVSQLPDGRYVLVACAGFGRAAVIGEPVSVSEAADVAETVLREAETRCDLKAHTLAVALLGLLHGARAPLPAARAG